MQIRNNFTPIRAMHFASSISFWAEICELCNLYTSKHHESKYVVYQGAANGTTISQNWTLKAISWAPHGCILHVDSKLPKDMVKTRECWQCASAHRHASLLPVSPVYIQYWKNVRFTESYLTTSLRKSMRARAWHTFGLKLARNYATQYFSALAIARVTQLANQEKSNLRLL